MENSATCLGRRRLDLFALRQPSIPVEYDDVQEGRHEVLPLAILAAFLQVKHASASIATNQTAVPQVQSIGCYAVCCDNFS